MANGYDSFFKQAQKNAGISSGKSAGKSAGKSMKGPAKPSGSPKFKLKPGADTDTPEQRLRQELAERVRQKKSRAIQRKRTPFPKLPAAIVVAVTFAAGVGYSRPDLLEQVLSKVSIPGVEIGFLGQASAAKTEAAAKAAETPEVKAANSTAQVAEAKPGMPSDFRQWSDEELSFFNKLNDRKKELDLREADLARLEEELQKQKAELDAKIKQLETMRTEISKTLKTRVANDQEKVDKLVQFYSSMKPQQAAKIIESLNEDLAVEVVDKMKKKNAADIMNMMDAKKARRLSELLTGYQRSPASSEAGIEVPAPSVSKDAQDAGTEEE